MVRVVVRVVARGAARAAMRRVHRPGETERGEDQGKRDPFYPETPSATQSSTFCSSWSEAWLGYSSADPITSAAWA